MRFGVKSEKKSDFIEVRSINEEDAETARVQKRKQFNSEFPQIFNGSCAAFETIKFPTLLN